MIRPKMLRKFSNFPPLRGSSQQDGASSAPVVSCVSNFCYCFGIRQRRFSDRAKISKNVVFSLCGKHSAVSRENGFFPGISSFKLRNYIKKSHFFHAKKPQKIFYSLKIFNSISRLLSVVQF